MSRIELMELLSDLSKTDQTEDIVNKSKDLFNQLLNHSIDEVDAEIEYNKILLIKLDKSFINILKTRPVYKSVKRYKDGSLSDIEIMKMVSSLITHLLINKEHNDQFDLSKYHYFDFINILTKYGKKSKVDKDTINSVLIEMGLIEESKDNSSEVSK